MSIFRFLIAVTLVTAVVLMPACTTKLDGNPLAAEHTAPTTSAPPADSAIIASVLPTADELSEILGDHIDEVDPLIGDASDLRDTMAGSEVTESRCIGIISPLERHTYDGAPVREVAYATLPEATFGAMALPSAEAARALFDTFVAEWSSCGNKTVGKSDGVTAFTRAISEVEADETLLSSVITMSTNASDMQVRTQRALGVAENYLIDVEILSARASSNEAVALTELMITKVPKLGR